MTGEGGIATAVATHMPQALAFLRALVETNSHTGNLDGIEANARLITERFASFGGHTHRKACQLPGTGAHLLLDAGAPGPPILLISHLDTVYTPDEQTRAGTSWNEEGSRVRGPGTYDIKGGTAMLWLVLRVLQEVDPEAWHAARWIPAWNAAEERLPADFSAWCLNLAPCPAAALVFEGDNQEAGGFEIVTQRSGLARFRLECHGKSTHAGNAHEAGRNAILGLSEKLLEISDWTDYALNTTVNVGIIRGGEATNRVPDRAEAWFEIRYTEGVDFAAKANCLAALVAAGARSGPLYLEQLDNIPPLVSSETSHLLAACWREAAAAQGRSVSLGARRGLSDANFFTGHAPTLDGLGPLGGNPHGLNRTGQALHITEFLDLASFAAKAELNVRALQRLARSL